MQIRQVPTLFSNYYHVREAGYDLRERIVFMCLWQEPISVKVLVKSKVPGYGITNSTWLTNICIKNAFGLLSQNNSLKHINKLIISSNISVCMLCYCHNVIILMCSMLYHKTIYHLYWECNVLDTYGNNEIFPLAPCFPTAVLLLN